MQPDGKIPDAAEKFCWTIAFEWPPSKSPYIQVALYADKEKRLYRAALDVAALIFEEFRLAQKAMIYEIERLLEIRAKMGMPEVSPMECLYIL